MGALESDGVHQLAGGRRHSPVRSSAASITAMVWCTPGLMAAAVPQVSLAGLVLGGRYFTVRLTTASGGAEHDQRVGARRQAAQADPRKLAVSRTPGRNHRKPARWTDLRTGRSQPARPARIGFGPPRRCPRASPAGTIRAATASRQPPPLPAQLAAVVALGGDQRQRVDATLVDLQRVDTGVVLRTHATAFVDGAIAVVVDAVAAHLGALAADERVGVIAIAAATGRIGVTILIDVPEHVIAGLSRLQAGIDGAGVVVRAGDRLAFFAAELGVAHFETVAEHRVLAFLVVRSESTARDLLIASVEGAVDAVVALRVIHAGPAQQRVGVRLGVAASAAARICVAARIFLTKGLGTLESPQPWTLAVSNRARTVTHRASARIAVSYASTRLRPADPGFEVKSQCARTMAPRRGPWHHRLRSCPTNV